jgi:hypothetical protein
MRRLIMHVALDLGERTARRADIDAANNEPVPPIGRNLRCNPILCLAVQDGFSHFFQSKQLWVGSQASLTRRNKFRGPFGVPLKT